jgi:hypothetical protein
MNAESGHIGVPPAHIDHETRLCPAGAPGTGLVGRVAGGGFRKIPTSG